MTAQRRWGEDEDIQLRELHALGLPLNKIYKRMGWSVGSVSTHAKSLGLLFDREQMAPAIAAAQFDAKATRIRIQEKLLARAEYLADRVASADTEGFVTLVPIGGGAQGTQTLRFVPPNDERALGNAMSSYLNQAVALAKLDADDGLSEARGIIGAIMGAIRESVVDVPRMNPTAEAKK